jgi:hypothetical protein
VCEPFAEMLESRGEISLVARRTLMITFISRAVSHAFDPRDEGACLPRRPSKPRGPY